MPSPLWWKEFYYQERAALGTPELTELFASAPSIDLAHCRAIIFPHTRLAISGPLTAAAAKAVIHSGCKTVVALGVLHGAPRERDDFHGIHFEDELTRSEFSLDNFSFLLKCAAESAGTAMPTYIPVYPLWRRGETPAPENMPGFGRLESLITDGACVVATADMVHHGAGYGTPLESRLDLASAEAKEYARKAITEQLSLLADRNYPEFLAVCDRARSDFRDVGPVLSALLPTGSIPSILDLTLVDYADVLGVEEPTWVAAALATFDKSPS